MAKSMLQFQLPEDLKVEVEDFVKENETTMSEFLRSGVKLYIAMRRYQKQGYEIVLRKKDDPGKEILLV